MAAFEKILKNTTGSAISLDSLGLEVPALGQNIINVEEYLLLGSIDALAELTPLINSGDIVVNDGAGDLAAAEAIRFIEYADRFTVEKNDVVVSRAVKTINVTGNAKVEAVGDGQVDISVEQLKEDVIVNLVRNGGGNDIWLSLGTNNTFSNRTQWPVIGDITLLGLSFFNSQGGSMANPMELELLVYEVTFDFEGQVQQSDPVHWTLDTNDAKSLVSPTGRYWTWVNDSTGENIDPTYFLTKDKKYAFRLRVIGGQGNPTDVGIDLVFTRTIEVV